MPKEPRECQKSPTKEPYESALLTSGCCRGERPASSPCLPPSRPTTSTSASSPKLLLGSTTSGCFPFYSLHLIPKPCTLTLNLWLLSRLLSSASHLLSLRVLRGCVGRIGGWWAKRGRDGGRGPGQCVGQRKADRGGGGWGSESSRPSAVAAACLTNITP